ncbi:MAG: hypothetical protein ACI85F_001380 [Bacteroidia bacterium]|jgi:hypothetical protein
MEMVTIKVFSYDHETYLYEPSLKSAGIEYHMHGQKTIAIDPLVSNAMGGIKLQVKAEDVERAKALVAEIERNNNSSDLGDVIEVNGQKFEKTLDECPKCESDEVYLYKQSIMEGLFKPFQKLEKHCNGCQNRW